MNMDKVYVVTSGVYSDYHIDGIFTTHELANAYVEMRKRTNEIDEMFNYDCDFQIVPWELDAGRDGILSGYLLWRVETGIHGDILDVTLNPIDDDRIGWYLSGGKNQPTVLNVTCVMKDRESAIKYVNDLRASLIASNKWIVSEGIC